MVYLTFIKQAESCYQTWILPDVVQQQYRLARFLLEHYGKPSLLIVPSDESGVANGKLVNLIFGVHGITITHYLVSRAPLEQADLFIKQLLVKAETQNIQHIVVVLPPKQFNKFLKKENPYLLASVNYAEKWQTMYIDAQQEFVASNLLDNYEYPPEFLKKFLTTLEIKPDI